MTAQMELQAGISAIAPSSAGCREQAEARFGHASSKFFAALRAREYARLDRGGQVYLDYTGGGVYAESQLRQHKALLERGVFGNPHSLNPTSLKSTELVEQARARILQFFNASPDEYVAIFTHNASTALKLVGESYPFRRGGRVVMTYDNHNSVNGLREYARRAGARTRYVPVVPPTLQVDAQRLEEALSRPGRGGANLFAFPAQSNFSGVQHPLSYIERAHAQGWDVILDCASFAPTNRLDLSRHKPDFVPLSFYKMFGYPTGLGCLLARRDAFAKLRRPWFAGGTVWGVSVVKDFHYMLEGPPAFEDGTVDYLGIPAIQYGLDLLSSVGMDHVHDHVMQLTGLLLEQLLALKHRNGSPLIDIYGPRDCSGRGASIALNFLDAQGAHIDERVIERTALDCNISVRVGCFCNPGGFEGVWELTPAKYKSFRPAFRTMLRVMLGREKFCPPTMQDYVDKLKLPNAGAIRVSLGIASNAADVQAFIEFARSFLDAVPDTSNLRPRLGC
jgi:molybdenum cofactor sulfurtransferase